MKNAFEVCMHNVKETDLKRGHNTYYCIFKGLFWEKGQTSADSHKGEQKLIWGSLIPVSRF